MPLILDGKTLSNHIYDNLGTEVKEAREQGIRPPGLALVLVGDDPASQVYVKGKIKACARVGIRSFDHFLPTSTPAEELFRLMASFNADDHIDGILVQLPLPGALRGESERLIEAISPHKDVDCFHPENVGLVDAGRPRFLPCTPGGILSLLDHANLQLGGLDAVVVGRSAIVGRPMAQLLLSRDLTVTTCHSHTRDLRAHVSRADVLVAAIGRARMIQGEWIKEGAVVIDVGMNRQDGLLCGDVDFATAAPRASAITPVPGGVGPMTIATLLQNTVTSWRRRVT